MRPRIDWMATVDERILELLADTGVEMTPKVIAHNIEYNRDYVNQRLLDLHDVGLLTRQPGERSGMYGVADVGRRFLAGELTDEELAELREAD